MQSEDPSVWFTALRASFFSSQLFACPKSCIKKDTPRLKKGKRNSRTKEAPLARGFECAGPVSRILYFAGAKPLSFIYDDGLPTPLATYPPTLGEQPLIIGIHGLATHGMYGPEGIATSAVGSYPTFSPLPQLSSKSSPRRLFSVTWSMPSRTSSR